MKSPGRRKSKQISVGRVKIGGGAPVSLQSMTKTETSDVKATVKQIKNLQRHGCEIVRVAVKDKKSARALKNIKSKIQIPLVADIHFNPELAIEAIKNGADKLRLNPGNIRDRGKISEILKLARKKKIPIRIGVNSGSVPKIKQSKSSHSKHSQLATAMVNLARSYIKLFESNNFYDIIISLKASDVMTTVAAYRKMAEVTDYPFHLGITASGLPEDGIIKSACGIGALLCEGFGDTIRVSLTGDPVVEVEAAKGILSGLGLRHFGPQIISCPTCGRCGVDLVKIVKDLKKTLLSTRYSLPATRNRLKIAIMGCVVNGPGEAKEADIGVAAGKKSGVLFKKGKIIKTIKERDFVKEVVGHIV